MADTTFSTNPASPTLSDDEWFNHLNDFYYITSGGAETVAALKTAWGVGSGVRKLLYGATSSTASTRTETVTIDNNPPSATGFILLKATVTPTNASSRLLVKLVALVGSTATQHIVAWFKLASGGSSALAAVPEVVVANSFSTIELVHEMAAGSTAARTYDFYMASETGNWGIAHDGASTELFGDAAHWSLTIWELAP